MLSTNHYMATPNEGNLAPTTSTIGKGTSGGEARHIAHWNVKKGAVYPNIKICAAVVLWVVTTVSVATF